MLMFYALYRTLGADRFDRAYRSFLGPRRATGGSTADLVAAFRGESRRVDPIFADWLESARWLARLAAGETISTILASY
jgi:hypothetical protein